MYNTGKKSKTGIIVVILIAVILVAAVGGYFIYKNLSGNNQRKPLTLDRSKGAIAAAKVENAQYMPDIDKYFASNSPSTGARTLSAKATTEDFTSLIDEYAKVYNYAGAGKYLGYDIYEIKNEIEFVVETVPAFNQWFRMPVMREAEGFISVPYYEDWAYYLEMNEETSALSVTRVCWSTRSSYLDFENRKTVENHADGSSFVQYEIMKTNYLKTETDEIVECYIYSVGVDNAKYSNPSDTVATGGLYNANEKNYYPFEFQYLRNVKDKSMVKYHITVAQRYGATQSFDKGGMDIRGLNPYGVRREFMIVNYDGYQDIDVTEIDQKFATLDNSYADGEVYFDVNDGNIELLLDTIGYKEDVSSLNAKQLTDKISKHIIDNFEIKNNWSKIYKEQYYAATVDTLHGAFYGKDIWISYLSSYVSCRGHNQDNVEFSVNADVYDVTKFDLTKEYSLSMALKSRESGKLYIVATDYKELERAIYNGGTENDYFYRLSSSINLSSELIVVDEDGIYDVVCVLTAEGDGGDVVLVDTLEPAFLRQYYGLVIPDSVDDNGTVHKYSVTGTGGKLVITVSSDEE